MRSVSVLFLEPPLLRVTEDEARIVVTESTSGCWSVGIRAVVSATQQAISNNLLFILLPLECTRGFEMRIPRLSDRSLSEIYSKLVMYCS